MRETEYYVYILASKRYGTLYIGVSNNLEIRIQQHRDGTGSVFTKKYHVYMLVYYQAFTYVGGCDSQRKTNKEVKKGLED